MGRKARHALVVLCHAATLERAGGALKRLVEDAKERGALLFQKIFRGMKGRERFKLRRKVEYITKAAHFKLCAEEEFQESDRSTKRCVRAR